MQSGAPTAKQIATIPSSINHGVIQPASEVTWLVRGSYRTPIEILFSVVDLLVLHKWKEEDKKFWPIFMLNSLIIVRAKMNEVYNTNINSMQDSGYIIRGQRLVRIAPPFLFLHHCMQSNKPGISTKVFGLNLATLHAAELKRETVYVHESSLITKPHKREIVSVLNSTLTESRYNSVVIDAKSLVKPSTVLAFLKVTSDFMLDDSSSLMKCSRGSRNNMV